MQRLDAYSLEPDAGHHDVIPLVGETGYRLRVGDWRVLFDKSDHQIEVLPVLHRREAYR